MSCSSSHVKTVLSRGFVDKTCLCAIDHSQATTQVLRCRNGEMVVVLARAKGIKS